MTENQPRDSLTKSEMTENKIGPITTTKYSRANAVETVINPETRRLNPGLIERIKADILNPHKTYVDIHGNEIPLRLKDLANKCIKANNITIEMIIRRINENERIRNQMHMKKRSQFLKDRNRQSILDKIIQQRQIELNASKWKT